MDSSRPGQPVTTLAVVDASALAAVAFIEAESPDVRARLRGRLLFSPSLVAYELMNVAVMKLRRHPDTAPLIREGLAAMLTDEAVTIWPAVDARAILALATDLRLTAYDASYLWLAQHLGAELVTLDKELADAARRVL